MVHVRDLVGRVVVVAGEDEALARVAATAAAAGASVAVVSTSLPDDVAATVRFRADPRTAEVWDRLAMHIEQHLGPVDGVATDGASDDVVAAVFDADLGRRGHGSVVVPRPDEPADDVVRRLLAPRREAPPRSPNAAGRQ